MQDGLLSSLPSCASSGIVRNFERHEAFQRDDRELAHSHGGFPAPDQACVPDFTHHREKARSEILDEHVVAVHEDMSPFKRSIENWSTLTESFPLPIQPFCPTLCTIPEDALEGNEDYRLSCIFSEDDTLVHCYGCHDAPGLTDDEHFNTMSLPWRLQIWVRGSNDSIAVRGLHEQPVLSGGFLQTPMSPSKQCESWMREHGHPTSGFVGSAQFLVTHSLDTTVIWRLDRLWRVAAAAAGGCKQDPPKPLHVRQTNESPSQLWECRAELWLILAEEFERHASSAAGRSQSMLRHRGGVLAGAPTSRP